MSEFISKQAEMFETFGYNLVTHKVTTEDGYILSLIRVSKKGQSNFDLEKVTEGRIRPAVLLVHGLVSTGEMWLLNGKQSLPCLLIEEGYDCWILSCRGGGLSKNHVFLNTCSKKYWDFSFHEIGLFDIPAVIDFILNVTGNADLDYIGHSQGCSVLYILLSQKPEYCAKIMTMVAIAYSPYINHLRNKFYRYLVAPITFIMGKLRYLYCRPTPVKTIAETLNKIRPSCVNKDKLTYWIIKKIGSKMGLYKKEQINKEFIAEFAVSCPATTSIKNVSHVSQQMYTGKFQAYDHGRSGNIKKYGQSTAPPYDLKKVKIPVASIFSASDQICVTTDVAHGVCELPNSIEIHEVTKSKMCHLDLLLGKDAPKLVYSKVIDILKGQNDSFTVSKISNL